MRFFSSDHTVAVVFDLDDTLYLERDYVQSGFAAAGAWLQRARGIEGLEREASRLFRNGQRHRIFDSALIELGIQPANDLVSRLVHAYRSHYPSIRLEPDACAFIRSHNPGCLAIVTDGWALAQRRKVSALGLRQSGIETIIYTDDWGRGFWKPHHRAFECVEHSMPHCSAFLYVADNPAKDFFAPRQRGWLTVQLARPERLHRTSPAGAEYAPDLVITSLEQLDVASAPTSNCSTRARASR